MRHRTYAVARWRPDRTWAPALATGSLAVLIAVVPTPLVPLARGYRALCEAFPPLTLLTYHLPPLPSTFLLALAAAALLSGGWTATRQLVGALRFNRRLRAEARALPPRLARGGRALGLGARLTFLAQPEPAAFCYGFVRPRVAVTAGLLARLDDEALVAVLAHERRHLRRRDPLRYLVIAALTAAVFMFPLAPALRRRLEARIELAADRAALAVAPGGALAGALLAVLAGPEAHAVGAAGLNATEARIAHLAGRPALPPLPARAVAGSLGLALVVGVTAADLAASADLVGMVCWLCPDLS